MFLENIVLKTSLKFLIRARAKVTVDLRQSLC
jgi:hypothetical protein